MAVNLHYCGSKLVGVSFKHVEEKSCCGAKMKKMNCCKEKSIAYKVNDKQDSGSKIVSLKNNVKTLTLFYYPVTDLLNLKPALFFKLNYGKPPDIDYSITYLLNGVFRI